MRALGFERVRPLSGGYEEWVRLGYPVEIAAPVAAPQLPIGN
jgi:3-mercaptopyruvate sulfurtransferase SseA